MAEISSLRLVIASLVTPFAVLLPVSLMAVITIIFPDAADGDAPVRAARIVLFALVPVAYLLLVLTMTLLTYALRAIQQLTFRNLMIISIVISLASGLLLGLQSPFGLKDQIIGLLIFTMLTLLSLAGGMIVWWNVATRWRRKSR